MVKCYFRRDDNLPVMQQANICSSSSSAKGIFSCCFARDTCLSSGLCGGKNNTYYTALCTDQTLEDPVCKQPCDGQYRDGIKYNSTADRWACCRLSDPSCSTFSGKNSTFQAPPPARLIETTMVVVDSTPTSSDAFVAPTSADSPLPTIQESSNRPPQTGTIVGISVSVTVVVILLVVAIVFFVLKWTRKKKQIAKAISPKLLPSTSSTISTASTVSTPPVKPSKVTIINPLAMNAPSLELIRTSSAEKRGTSLVEASNSVC